MFSEQLEPRFVENLGYILLNIITKPVLVIVHPFKDKLHGFIGLASGFLSGLDPGAEQLPKKHAEIATGIVDLFCFFISRPS